MKKIITLLSFLLTSQCFGFSAINLNNDSELQVKINYINLCKDTKCEPSQTLKIFTGVTLYPTSKYGSNNKPFAIALAFHDYPEYPYVQFNLEGWEKNKTYLTNNSNCQIRFVDDSLPNCGWPIMVPGDCEEAANPGCQIGYCTSGGPRNCDVSFHGGDCICHSPSRCEPGKLTGDPPVPKGTSECCIPNVTENAIPVCLTSGK